MNAPAPTETPQAKLFSLTAEAQDLLPAHTCKAVLLRASSKDSIEEQCKLLSGVLDEFGRGVAG
jgi:hypothetical protein